MIAKITKGARVGDIAAYVHGPGRHNEHTYDGQPGGCVIGGNLGREGARSHKGWAADMHQYAREARGKWPIWQVSLRNPDGDRVMSDIEWAEAGQLLAEDMGYEDRPWVMVRHADDHVHVVMCRQGDTGPMWDDSKDRSRVMEATSELEKRYDLTCVPLPGQDQKDEPNQHREIERTAHKITQGEYARAVRTKATPPRVRLAERVRKARDRALVRGGIDVFEHALAGYGVTYRRHEKKSGEIKGYAFHLEGDVDADGDPIYYPASKLDRSLSWAKLGPELAEAPPLHIVDGKHVPPPHIEAAAEKARDEVPVPKRKLLETKKKHTQRVEDDRSSAYDDAIAEGRLQDLTDLYPRQLEMLDEALDGSWDEKRERVGMPLTARLARTQAQQEEAQRKQQEGARQQAETQQAAADRAAKRAKAIEQFDRRAAGHGPLSPSFEALIHSGPPERSTAPQKDDRQPGG